MCGLMLDGLGFLAVPLTFCTVPLIGRYAVYLLIGARLLFQAGTLLAMIGVLHFLHTAIRLQLKTQDWPSCRGLLCAWMVLALGFLVLREFDQPLWPRKHSQRTHAGVVSEAQRASLDK